MQVYSWDKFDAEAESEGRSIRTSRQFGPSIVGKALAKSRRGHDSANTKIANRIQGRYVVSGK